MPINVPTKEFLKLQFIDIEKYNIHRNLMTMIHENLKLIEKRLKSLHSSNCCYYDHKTFHEES